MEHGSSRKSKKFDFCAFSINGFASAHRANNLGESEARKGKVVHMSSGHLPDDSRVVWKECVELAQAGYEVQFVVPYNGARPSGCPREVEIVPVRRRTGRAARLLGSPFLVSLAALRRNAAVYHFHDPELIPYGLMMRFLGRRVVYDVHEDLPRDILFKSWIPRPARSSVSRGMAALEWVAGRVCSGVVAATPTIAHRFPGEWTALVQNYVKISEFAVRNGPPYRERSTIAYVGAITRERCALEMVTALAHVRPEVRLVLAGQMWPASLEKTLAARPEWHRVDYRGRQDRGGVRNILGGARLGLVLFYPVQSYIESQPIKLFEYMAAGLPVIAADFPKFRAIVEENRCGLCVDSRNLAAIGAAIEWMINHPDEAETMGQNGRDLVQRIFNWETEAKRLRGLYEVILGASSGH